MSNFKKVYPLSIMLISSLTITPVIWNKETVADWGNHLWLYSNAEPFKFNLFLGNETIYGYFYPIYSFYGGGFYSLTKSILSLTQLSNHLAFKLLLCILFNLWIIGSYLLFKKIFNNGLLSSLLSVSLSTSAYVMTNLFGRAAVTEYAAGAFSLLLVYFLYTNSYQKKRVSVIRLIILAILIFLVITTHAITVMIFMTILFLFLGPYLLHKLFARSPIPNVHDWFISTLVFVSVCFVASPQILRTFILRNDTKVNDALSLDYPSSTIHLHPYNILFSLDREATKTTGIDLFVQLPTLFFLLNTVFIIYLFFVHKKLRRYQKEYVTIYLLFVLTCLLIFIINNAYMVDNIAIFKLMQFPYRLLTLITFLIILLTGFINSLLSRLNSKIGNAVSVLVFIISLISVSQAYTQGRNAQSLNFGENEIASLVSNEVPYTWYSADAFSAPASTNIKQEPNYELLKYDGSKLTIRANCERNLIVLPLKTASWFVEVKPQMMFLGHTSDNWMVYDCKANFIDVEVTTQSTQRKVLYFLQSIGLIILILTIRKVFYAKI